MFGSRAQSASLIHYSAQSSAPSLHFSALIYESCLEYSDHFVSARFRSFGSRLFRPSC